MSVKSENNRRIAKNTLLLYIRMLFIMAVSLYTSRVVLNSLGVEDYGIYNVVGGVTAMFTILSGSLSAAISRFITFELGKGNLEKLKTVFSTAVTVQLLLAAIIVIAAEAAGVWFLNAKMNIPAERMYAANWVLQCSIFTFAINLVSVPYNAAIIAHERMSAFAYISIIEVTLKLGAVFALHFFMHDKLIAWAVLLFLISAAIRVVYGIYCKRHFEECTYRFVIDKPLLKEITGFAGWNFIGSSSAVLRDQGTNIALNLFCGPVVNAARGISVQVQMAIQNFVTNFMTALNPQITKSYACGDRTYMLALIRQGARLSFYLMLLLSLPVLIETPTILKIWLRIVPDHTVNFVRLILLFTLTESLSGPLITAMLATGRIRNYQLVVGGLQMMNFPISYLLLRGGAAPEVTLIVAIAISFCCLFSRLWMLRRPLGLDAGNYFKQVIGRVFVVALLAAILPMVIHLRYDDTVARLLVVCAASWLSTLSVIYYIGLDSAERAFVWNKITSFRRRYFTK